MPYLPPTPRASLRSQNNNDELMKSIVEKCWRGEQITREEGAKFVWAISDEEGKKIWIADLSSMHAQGLDLIPESTFAVIGDLMWCTLSSMMDTQDYRHAKDCINLTQSFYSENAGEKKFLFEFLMLHPLWGENYNWEKLISIAIQQEMDNYIKEKEGNTGDEQTEKMIVVSQLTWYGRTMQTFQIEEQVAQNILNIFTERYQVGENIPLW